MTASLRTRLTLVAVGIALVAVLVAAAAVQQLTERDIRASLERDLDTELLIRDELAFYGFEVGGWGGVSSLVEALATDTGERIAVATLSGEILADSEQLLFGEDAPLPAQPTIVDPLSELVSFAFEGEDPDAIVAFENQVVEGCLDLLGVPANRFEFEGGSDDLVLPARVLTVEEETAFLSCLADADVDDPEFFLDPSPFEDELQEDFGDAIDELDDLDEEDLAEFGLADVEPVQLFVGYGDGRDDGLFPSLTSWPFLAAVGAVIAAAAAVAFFTAQRMTRPIAALTAAAQSMRNGELGVRVPAARPDEIGDLGRAFNDMAGSLQAEDQARRTLTTDVAHELRSPLANLRGYLEGIQDGVVEPDVATIASLHEETTSIQALVDDLQQLSLAEAGRLALHREPTDVGDLVERVVIAHAATAAGAGVGLSARATEGCVTMLDPERIRQVLTNLVSNGVRHTTEGGAVLVLLHDRRSEADGAGIEIEVRDNGEGIAPEHLPHLFDRFYRADESRNRATGGTGLGLAITRELVHAHGGTIEVRSRVGAGTSFHVHLPDAAEERPQR